MRKTISLIVIAFFVFVLSGCNIGGKINNIMKGAVAFKFDIIDVSKEDKKVQDWVASKKSNGIYVCKFKSTYYSAVVTLDPEPDGQYKNYTIGMNADSDDPKSTLSLDLSSPRYDKKGMVMTTRFTSTFDYINLNGEKMPESSIEEIK